MEVSMKLCRVFQFHSGSAVGDAVTNSMFYIQNILRDYSINSRLFVEHLDPKLAQRLSLIGEFNPRPDDVLIIHHSMGHDIISILANLKCKKILLYHNVTPARFYNPGSHQRRYVSIGLKLLDDLRGFVDGAIGVSEYNCRELRMRGFDNPVAIPALRDLAPLRNRSFNPEPQYFDEPRYQLLFVGRINPNKGQSFLVEFMRRYADAFDFPLYLTLVGNLNPGEPYADALLAATASAGLEDRILITGHVSEEDLYGHYRAADAFVCLSEHEGFGVPLLEAMAFDVPVLAYGSSAVADTMGGAGIVLKSTDADELAERLRWLFADRDRRRTILKDQRKRLLAFDRAHVAAQLIDYLRPFLPVDVTPRLIATKPPLEQARTEAAEAATRHYRIEGPCETSYSLAITNRHLAIALEKRPHCLASLVPMEGVPGYRLDEKGVKANPEIAPLLQTAPLNPEAVVATFRNMYPMRPAGMLGDFSLCGMPYEETEISPKLARLINRYVDGMLPPTQFVLDVYRNSGISLPAAISSHGLDHFKNIVRPPRPEARPFTFLHISSGLARKGIEELFLGYAAAFSKADNVVLVVKTHHNETNVVSRLYRQIFEGRSDAPAIKLLFEDLPESRIVDLYQIADAVVLPTRGEGFCYPAAEAMVYGVPVVITGYSGQLDFCCDENSILVDYDFELSGSHLGITEAMWVKVRVYDLALKMRRLVQERSDPAVIDIISRAHMRAQEMTWMSVAESVDSFVQVLSADASETRKLKVGWVSTWNTKCGIATYSEFITANIPSRAFDIEILANHWQGVRPDEANVFRVWTHRGEPLDNAVKTAIEREHDIVVFQYNYGFHTLAHLAQAVDALDEAGKDVYIFFHKTEPVKLDGRLESIADVASSFKKAARLIVHSVEDVNRLKQFGLVENVVKLPHGAMEPMQLRNDSVKELLGFGGRTVIGSYGFLFPAKGIQQLILAFSLVARAHPDAVLLLANAMNEDPACIEEKARCVALIENLGLQNRVIMINDYLEHEVSMMLLQACDVIVFPYQRSGESASGAIRYGLSARRPILTTPLDIFKDVAGLVEQAKGFSAFDIAEGVERLLSDKALSNQLVAAQTEWLHEHNWRTVTERFANMIIGLYQDRHQTIIKPPFSDAPFEAAKETSKYEDWMDTLGDRAFVRFAYQRTLRRDATEDEINSFSRDVGSNIEARRRLYETLRSPDAIDNASAAPIARTMIAFSSLNSSDNYNFVKKLYRELLGREADPGGLEYYVKLLDSGAAREDAARHIIASDEFIFNNRPIELMFDAVEFDEEHV